MSKYEDYDSVSHCYDNQRVAMGADVMAAMIQFHSGKQLKDLHILDAGCGTGNYAKAFIEYGVGHVTLLDASSGMLEKAKVKLADAIDTGKVKDVVKATMPPMPFPDASFDAVMFNLVLHHLESNPDGEHFPTVLKVLTEARRVLKADGVLAISECAPQCAHDTVRHVHHNKDIAKSHAKQYPRDKHWNELFQSSGFNIISNIDINVALPDSAQKMHALPDSAQKMHALPDSAQKMHALPDSAQKMHALPDSAQKMHALPDSAQKMHALPDSAQKMHALPDSAQKMHALPDSAQKMHALPDSAQKMHALPDSAQKMHALPDSAQKMHALPDSVQKMHALPDSAQKMHALPDSAQKMHALPDSVQKMHALPDSAQKMHALPDSAQKMHALPDSAQKMHALPDSAQKMHALPDSAQKMHALPDSAQKMHALPDSAQKMHALPDSAQKMHALPDSVQKMHALPDSVQKMHANPEEHSATEGQSKLALDRVKVMKEDGTFEHFVKDHETANGLFPVTALFGKPM